MDREYCGRHVGYIHFRAGKKPKRYDTLEEVGPKWDGELRAIVQLTNDDFDRASRMAKAAEGTK